MWSRCLLTQWALCCLNVSIISPAPAPMSWTVKFDLIPKTCNTAELSGAFEVGVSDLFSPYTVTALFQPVGPFTFAVCRSQFFRGKVLDFIVIIRREGLIQTLLQVSEV